MRWRWLPMCLLFGCVFEPTIPSGRVTCAGGERCPTGFTCTTPTGGREMLCCRNPGCEGEGLTTDAPDARATPDVRTSDVPAADASQADRSPDVPVVTDGAPPITCPMGGTPPDCDPCNGACGALANVEDAVCASARCKVNRCRAGFSDCDGKSENGCEADLSRVETCGGCQTNCRQTLPNAQRPVCSAGRCAENTCPAGFAHCTSNAADVCETNIRTAERCGSCSNNCNGLARVAATTCVDGRTCQIDRCNAGWDNCDRIAENGCEADLTRTATCGSCQLNCAAQLKNVRTPSCAAGKCAYDACADHFRDYDGNRENGCETVTPLGLPEAANLMLYYSAGVSFSGGTWTDRSGKGRTATCTNACPTVLPNAVGGEEVAVFAGAQFMSIGPPALRFGAAGTGGLTLFALFRPGMGGDTKATLIEFADAGAQNRITVRRSSTVAGSLSLEVCNRGTCTSTRFSGWTMGSWVRLALVTRPGGKVAAVLNDVTLPQEPLGTALPDHVELSNNRIGGSAAGADFLTGQVAELAVFDRELPDGSIAAILGYYKRKYEL